jgi:hypothetical protein
MLTMAPRLLLHRRQSVRYCWKPRSSAARSGRGHLLQRQVTAAEADSSAAAELATNERKVKQEETRHATRVKEINYDDDSTLGTSAKHTALNGSKNGSENSHTGLLECVKYWARGSFGVVFQLVMALISAYSLEDKVCTVVFRRTHYHVPFP